MRWRGHEGCSVDGCVGKHRSRGWCRAHYGRWLRYGDPIYQPFPSYDVLCYLPECGRPRESRGLCHAHYQRWRRRNKVTDNWGSVEIAKPTWRRSSIASTLEAERQSGHSPSGPSLNMSSNDEMTA